MTSQTTPLLQASTRKNTNASDRSINQVDEDTSSSKCHKPTSQREIFGWYLYGFACEPFIVSCVGTYVPLLLEQLAKENGVLLSDKITPCLSQIPDPLLPPHDGKPQHCVIYVLGKYIDTSSYALYTFSVSVLVQTLFVISMSGAADRGHYRKTLLLTFGLLGGFITSNYIFVNSEHYYIAGILAILANSCFGAVNVCGNSFLPVLVSHHKSILYSDQESNDAQILKKGFISSQISGTGAAVGYFAAFLVQIITMFIIIKTKSTTFSIQLAISIVGLWWFLFQIPLFFLLESRPSKPLKLSPDLNVFQVIGVYIIHGWRTLYLATKQASYLKDVLIFLLGWFIVSDSITTINSAAILFARSELSMTTPQLAIIGLLTVMSAIAGSFVIPKYLVPRFKLTPKKTMMLIIMIASLIPFYGILGFYFESFGLNSTTEMFFLAVWYGFALGGLATISRSFFSMLIPKGKESIFFALFSITDKGSSMIGPVIVGLVTDKTHNIRYCFYFLFFLLILSLPIFSWIDLERGREEALLLENSEAEVEN